MPPRDRDSRRDATFEAATALTRSRVRGSRLDRSTIVRAARAIVNQDGLEGLTMRRIADDLGVGLATLYNVAGGKEAILDEMIEMVFAELPEPDRTRGNEFALVGIWVATHELLFENPAVAQLTALKLEIPVC